MPDPRYEHPINGLGPDELPAALRASIASVEANFPPRTGVCVFVLDCGAGGAIGYIANVQRTDMIRALREWIRKTESQN